MRAPLMFALVFLFVAATTSTTQPIPLEHAHAHNDYEHDRPLLDALDCGFCSVEADVHLIAGQLLVAHDARKTLPDRTLAALYLDPLKQRIAANHGRVYADHSMPLTLLIDIKSAPEPTYRALRDLLVRYRDLLTSWQDDRKTPGPIEVIVTGKVPRRAIAAEHLRYVACDGTLADLDTNPSSSLVPQINVKWTDHFQWRGVGPMPEVGRRLLREYVDRAHAQSRRIRFWDAPDNPAAWAELRRARVDLINTDDLPGLRDFLSNERP